MRPGKAPSLLLLLALASSVTTGCRKVHVNGGDAAGLAVVGVVGLLVGSIRHEPDRELSPCERARAGWRNEHRHAVDIPPEHLRCSPGGEWPEGAEEVVGAAVYAGVDPAEPPPVVVEGDPGERTEVLTATCGGTDAQIEQCEKERARRKLLKEQRLGQQNGLGF